MSQDTTPATKADVADAIREITPGIVTEIVTKVVKTATTEILSAVGDQSRVMNDDIDNRFTNLDSTTSRIEARLENVDRKLGEHEVRVEKLEHRPA
ncbi:MAG: hypothetical protein Q7R60_01365 [bacterium]|nr:hypothetical protein [bacterium]